MSNQDVKVALGQFISGSSRFLCELENPDQRLHYLVIAHEEGILPLAIDKLDETGKESLEVEFQAYFSMKTSSYQMNAVAVELYRLSELRRVATAFLAAGLKFIAFKGAPLAYTLYKKAYLRVRTDTDLLFCNREDADRAWEIVRQLGYCRQNTVDGELISSEFACYKDGAGGNSVFDVHWNLSNAVQFRSFSFAEVYEKSVDIPQIQPGFRGPSALHSFIIACHHRLAHAFEHQQDRLIWLYDIHLLVSEFSDNDWKELLDDADVHDFAPACLDGIQASMRYFGTDVDSTRIHSLELIAQSSRRGLSLNSSLLKADLGAIKSQSSFYNKLKLIFEHLFPSPAYIRKKYGVSSRWILPWYYLKRMIEGVRKRL